MSTAVEYRFVTKSGKKYEEPAANTGMSYSKGDMVTMDGDAFVVQDRVLKEWVSNTCFVTVLVESIDPKSLDPLLTRARD